MEAEVGNLTNSNTAESELCPRISARSNACRDDQEGKHFQAGVEKAPRNINLYSIEIAFGFLVDSHAIVFTPLMELIAVAIKTKYLASLEK